MMKKDGALVEIANYKYKLIQKTAKYYVNIKIL